MRDIETNERKTKREEKKEEEIGWSRNIYRIRVRLPKRVRDRSSQKRL